MENEEAARSVLKELEIAASSADFSGQIEAAINHLLVSDFNKLISILYRMDISEEKLKKMLHDRPTEDAAKIIAEQMVMRQAEKIKSRNQFRPRDNNIDDDEKW